MSEAGRWNGTGSRRLPPPAAYFEHLQFRFPDEPATELKQLSDSRVNELALSALPPTATAAPLEAMVADGWLVAETSRICPNPTCDHEPDAAELTAGRCAVCDVAIDETSSSRAIYTRDLAPQRDVDWVVVIHGMNTKGVWQEEFSWFMGTTWGRSVPVAIYKYGIVIAGVVMPWRRRKLQRRLRGKLAELSRQAERQGFGKVPDIVAHSFGTWLLGHILRDEMQSEEPLRFGRVILAGSILRPDFEWDAIKRAGIVGEVLNHYATGDRIVPLARWTIPDSGPSGTRGFDSAAVINVRATGLGHSDLFAVDKCVKDGQYGAPCPDHPVRGDRHLDLTYQRYWRPFLLLPNTELETLPEIRPPQTR